jgi:hypothetical protein
MRLQILRLPMPKNTTLHWQAVAWADGKQRNKRGYLDLQSTLSPCKHQTTEPAAAQNSLAQGVKAAPPGSPHHLAKLQRRKEQVIASKHDCAAGHVDAKRQRACRHHHLQTKGCP